MSQASSFQQNLESGRDSDASSALPQSPPVAVDDDTQLTDRHRPTSSLKPRLSFGRNGIAKENSLLQLLLLRAEDQPQKDVRLFNEAIMVWFRVPQWFVKLASNHKRLDFVDGGWSVDCALNCFDLENVFGAGYSKICTADMAERCDLCFVDLFLFLFLFVFFWFCRRALELASKIVL